ncbi:DNA cytosine methyltransferase, partial [Microcoleus sp. N9_B4]|uniref:DNA cytosine methyltransferase n=1 Tax=Microcoleus sp. N9_B4 TaxID=3055386 RepID=UPI004040BD7A
MQSIDGWLDLCSGIGAGFPYAGIKLWERSPNYFCEWNSYCRRILARRFPGIYRIDDIRKCDFNLNSSVQLITASPPCQPFSVDGKRLAVNDSRNCFPDVLRAIQTARPNFAVIENVGGLL